MRARGSRLLLNFCYLADTIGARWDASDSGITRTNSGWCKFRDLVSLLASRGLSLRANYILHVHVV